MTAKIGLLLTISAFVCVNAQAQSIETEKCNIKDVELQDYTKGQLPENSVVIKANTILLDRKVEAVADLSEKEIRKIQKQTKKFKSCSAYIDFGQTFFDKELNPTLTDNHLTYLVVNEMEEPAAPE